MPKSIGAARKACSGKSGKSLSSCMSRQLGGKKKRKATRKTARRTVKRTAKRKVAKRKRR